ncbi:hypothetical protein SOVF_053040 [Spinacia oleracea]|uniref:non-specific serine/threonine protein kinase n=1 Tax=Spinacia oleracea TaxID=3562 RepID=A0A9R0K749_SPIOL|nr:serine/threonine-protein kinase WNK8-like [Spinacia oleracea]KNA20380.1 hypothetical protein SOVF_053040 [Spinacia oleracea]
MSLWQPNLYGINGRDLIGQFVRYGIIIGGVSDKVVFKGFDGVNGLEIGWSETILSKETLKNEKYVETLCKEVDVVMSLKHDNIVRCYDSWVDVQKKRIYMIVDLPSSGNLGDYLRKNVLSSDGAIKNWCRQILQGLDYLHSHNPPIIHRDVKLENIFINGDTGIVKLGNFNLAMFLDEEYSGDTYNSPEFTAPEVNEGEACKQTVDIYSFGMCVLQMITLEHPYSEYVDKDYARTKARSGIKPDALTRVADPVAKKFIERCLVPASERPTAVVLLDDPFLAQTSVPPINSTPISSQDLGECLKVVPRQVCRLLPKTSFRLIGRKLKKTNDLIPISVKLWITYFRAGEAAVKEIVLSLESDISQVIEEQVATGYGLSNQDIVIVSQLMGKMVTELSSPDVSRKKYYEIDSHDNEVIPLRRMGWFRTIRACLLCQTVINWTPFELDYE